MLFEKSGLLEKAVIVDLTSSSIVAHKLEESVIELFLLLKNNLCLSYSLMKFRCGDVFKLVIYFFGDTDLLVLFGNAIPTSIYEFWYIESYKCREEQKDAYLYYILKVHRCGRTIVFFTSIATLQ